ncbi:LytTR family DNA-binding domain-containing protein [Thalassotalea psychrophila]|uniref:LytTR family DNA-binding domain-containing protein n=1 Tax=Thalassotalea psychrophila TaxID=3065647 RepID=A0ABY9TWG7_9GAMM|nr:LytTR family DNA-binding domain-containing protein [Colwelliaceae bacterium SQ149]
MTNREINQKNQQINRRVRKSSLINDIVTVSVVGLILGFLSPFGMAEIPLQWSIAYWLVTCLSGYFIYMPCGHLGELLLSKWLSMHWLRVAISTSIASVLMSFVVLLLVNLFFNVPISYGEDFFKVLPKVIVIGGLLTFIGMVKDYIKYQNDKLVQSEKLIDEQKTQASAKIDQKFETFMALLPVEKRGELFCLEMSDHYLKVYTDKGHHLLLMRFKDALEMLADFQGLQTHRSWWVSLSAVTKLEKDGRKVFLLVNNELQVPVSRTYMDAVKAANIH